MNEHLKELIDISRYYGLNRAYVIAGGGNTSYKNSEFLWVKASGFNLSTIDESGFCKLDRRKLDEIANGEYSSDETERESEVKKALLDSRTDSDSSLRPSVEASLHNLFSYRYVVHTHPMLINGLMCSRLAAEKTRELFGNDALFMPYINPGYLLFKEVEKQFEKYRSKFSTDPKILFIQNHGIFVASDEVEEIYSIYGEIETKLKEQLKAMPDLSELPVSDKMIRVLPALRMILSDDGLKTVTAFNNRVISKFTSSREQFEKSIATPFTPDQIVYCLSEYLYVDEYEEESIIKEAKVRIEAFLKRKKVLPKVIFIKNEGALVVERSASSVEYLKDIVIDFCAIADVAENFGGVHPLEDEQVKFIENWEVENYRKKIALGGGSIGRAESKVVIVTGAAQGFGAGIAEILFKEGANLVVADMNVEKGVAFTESLNSKGFKNRALFIHVDVTDALSVEQLIQKSVEKFGGLDVMISNAGILHAGGLDEMKPEVFELMTKVNYSGYFLCAKYAQTIMKIQHRYSSNHFTDIIQINSKSGLKGSNKNFAYAGGKFGGIGLTQSFALELMPYNIKVNSICPGNYFDGPLWSDPERGLFSQYLKAGKVPGATGVEEVRAFYEAQVPAGRGCTPEDVAKAIFYVIEQHYETGQAIPVTGGQNMLN